ncbi:putative F-box protein At3g10240 [Prosopis cineraria]|uniref:putative F-box protein At3g10240 n=1 Tax=Prosopis cineraria TaxID=364024 RepID=UPI0024100803|nr:putative F-box protein At3g10240 [Prosopis cineraria]
MPYFIADHLHHSSHHKPSLLIQWHCLMINSDFCLVKLDRYMQELIVYESEVQNAPLIDSFMPVHIVGSSNGLLCLEFSNSILFWNPATTETRLDLDSVPVANDYKVVIIYVIQEDDVYRVNRVQVYSVSTKSWKKVEFGNLEGLCVSSESVAANGAVFWYGFNGDEDEFELDCYRLIVSFDIANEVFTLMPVPDLDYGEPQKLTVYENNLAMLCNIRPEESEDYEYDCIDLWVMEEATSKTGERWSWANKYTSSPFRGLIRLEPMAIWRNEIVCEARLKFNNKNDETKVDLCLLNVTTSELEWFDINKYSTFYRMLNHVESLVSIGNVLVQDP